MPFSKSVVLALFSVLFALLLAQCSQSPTSKDLPPPNRSTVPKRLLLLVFDQMRPDFIDRFDLKNFKRIQREGLSFPNALVGHMSSLTVVSHQVITTGLLPKHLPWQDEIFHDLNGKLGKKGTYYSTVDLNEHQFAKLLAPTSDVSLLSRIQNHFAYRAPSERDPRVEERHLGHVYTIAQKMYAALAFGAPLTSPIISLGPKLLDPALKGWRAPAGIQVPAFFLQPFGGRYYLDSNPSYGSDATLYPLDGNRMFVGHDPKHLGGDAWVGDGVRETMERDPKWTAIFASFGAIDKVLHMLGEHDLPSKEPWAIKHGITLRQTLQRADAELGKILEVLEKNQWLDETAILITADHGGQVNTSFHGITEPGHGSGYLLTGKGANWDSKAVPPALKPIIKSGITEAIIHDSALRIWTTPIDRNAQAKFAQQLQSLPGAAEIYTLQKTGKSFHYIRTHRSPKLIGPSLEWANKHHQNLLESFATEGSPDAVVLLFNNHGYGLKGEHGGAQEEVQKIPLFIRSPNILLEKRGTALEVPARLVDINPMVSRLLKLPEVSRIDGTSQFLETNLND